MNNGKQSKRNKVKSPFSFGLALCLIFSIIKNMNTISRLITGVLAIILGLFLIVLAVVKDLWILIYGVPIFIIGFFILFNSH